jgi:cytoskeleton protein RodZ
MSEALPRSDTPALMSSPMPGRLRQAREEAGLHIAVLATMLKVPVKKLDALEQGRFHELPDLTFARALASSACRHLKIDPAPVLAELPGVQLAPLTQMAVDSKPAFRPAGGTAASPTVPTFLKAPSVWAAGALLLCAAGVYWWPSSGAFVPPWASVSSANDVVVAPPSLPAPDPVVSTALPQITSPSSASDAGSPALVEAVSDTGTASSTVTPMSSQASGVPAEPAASSAEQPATEALLMIVGVGDSWLEVVDAQGTVLLRRMLRTGEEHRFSAQPPYRVVLGNAGAARVVVRGKDFDTTPFVRNSVAKFEVQ